MVLAKVKALSLTWSRHDLIVMSSRASLIIVNFVRDTNDESFVLSAIVNIHAVYSENEINAIILLPHPPMAFDD